MLLDAKEYLNFINGAYLKNKVSNLNKEMFILILDEFRGKCIYF